MCSIVLSPILNFIIPHLQGCVGELNREKGVLRLTQPVTP